MSRGIDDGPPLGWASHNRELIRRYSQFFFAKGWLCVLCGEFFQPHGALERHFDKEHLRYTDQSV